LRGVLAEDFRAVASLVLALPKAACPDDYASIAIVTKPGDFSFREQDRTLGSMYGFLPMGGDFLPDYVDRLQAGRAPLALRTAVVHFYFAARANFYAAVNKVERLGLNGLKSLSFIELARPMEPEDRLKTAAFGDNQRFEVTLVLSPVRLGWFPYKEFKDFAENLGFEVLDKTRVTLIDVARVLITGPRSKLPLLAEFAFIREILEAASANFFARNKAF
jgi:hypothetical protein